MFRSFTGLMVKAVIFDFAICWDVTIETLMQAKQMITL